MVGHCQGSVIVDRCWSGRVGRMEAREASMSSVAVSMEHRYGTSNAY
jgi:hypothetical protein